MSDASTSKPLILIADDNLEMRRLVKMSLSPLDVDFIEAKDGEEALTQIIQEQPTLVVLDVMMPELTGWEILKYVREKPEYAGTKVVMLTAIGATTTIGGAVGAGAVPGHTDKERTIVPVISGPPRLRGGQRLVDIRLERLKIQPRELGRVVKIGPQRVGAALVLT